MQLNLRESSNIEAAWYDGQNLTVEFKGGQQYVYFNVDEATVLGWEASDSAGKYHNMNIKFQFEYSKVEEVEEVI